MLKPVAALEDSLADRLLSRAPPGQSLLTIKTDPQFESHLVNGGQLTGKIRQAESRA